MGSHCLKILTRSDDDELAKERAMNLTAWKVVLYWQQGTMKIGSSKIVNMAGDGPLEIS